MGIYRPRSFGLFDETLPLVAGRQMTLDGAELQGGDPIPAETDVDVRRRLWMVEHAHYAEDYTPTPEEVTHGDGLEWMDDVEGVSVEAGDNGWYTIKAAWLGEDGEKVHGAEAAEARAAEIRAEGDTKGISYTHSGGGWYTIIGPNVPEGTKVQGEEAAKAKVKELREQAPADEEAPPTEPGEGEGEGDGATETETGDKTETGGEGDNTEE